MKIDHDAPVVVTARASVEASPDAVWETLADVARWPTWHPGIRSVRTEGPAAVGRRFVWRSGPATLTSVMQDVEPGARLCWSGNGMGMRARHTWTLSRDQASGDATTTVTTEESMNGPLAKLFRRGLQKRVQHDLDAWLEHLRAEMEVGATA